MNHRNPAIKRILADVKELQKHPSSRYHAVPLENDMFEWHFTIRGPDDTPFAGGMYHGRILLPAEYPFKPPNIVFLTKNGRFEVGTKICLSISAYHEETWQPAWGVRTMLEAIISFMPTEGVGAIGALDWTAEERKRLAVESKSYCCPQCGSIAALLPAPSTDANVLDLPDPAIQAQVAQLHLTRQHSENDRYRAGGLISDISAATTGLGGEEALDMTATMASNAIATAEEDVSAHVDRVLDSFENDADNDCTLNQMINMELDQRSMTPVHANRAGELSLQDTVTLTFGTSSSSASATTTTASASGPTEDVQLKNAVDPVVANSPTASKSADISINTQTLSEIRKQRLREKQQLLEARQQLQEREMSVGLDVEGEGRGRIDPVAGMVDILSEKMLEDLNRSRESGPQRNDVKEKGTVAVDANDDAAVDRQLGLRHRSSAATSSAQQPVPRGTPPPQAPAPAPAPRAADPAVRPPNEPRNRNHINNINHNHRNNNPPPQRPPQNLQQRQHLHGVEDAVTFARIHVVLSSLIVCTLAGIASIVLNIVSRGTQAP